MKNPHLPRVWKGADFIFIYDLQAKYYYSYHSISVNFVYVCFFKR